jgi:GT2 family glycosyltransferase
MVISQGEIINNSMDKTILLTTAYIDDDECLYNFIEHLNVLTIPAGWQILLVIADNAGNLYNKHETLSFVEVFKPERNLGYLGGCKYVVDNWVAQQGRWPDWLGIVNNDIEFEPDFFVKLVNLDLPNDVGIIGPNIKRCKDGTGQNPLLKSRMKPWKVKFLRFIYSYRVTSLLHWYYHSFIRQVQSILGAFFPKPLHIKGSEFVYAVHGSAMFLRPIFFENGGSLAFRGFLMGEEIFLAEEASKTGLKVVWIQNLNVTHNEHTSTGMKPSRLRYKWRSEALSIIWDDYYKPESFSNR